MKEKYIHIILLILIFTFPGALITLRAQSPTLDLKIEIKDETYNQKMANAEVVIYKNGAPYKKLTTDDKGRLFVQVPLGVDYKVEFKKNGYVTKHIIIDTKNIPSEDASYGFEYPMEVNLFEDIPEIDFSILQKPVAILKFDNKTGFFEYDKDYTNSILKQLEELKKAYQEKMKALAEQRKKMEAEYNAAINAGNKAFNEKKYAEAKAQFEKALSIKPNEIYPANKIKEIEELLKQMAEKDRQYNDLIQQADQLAQNEKYPEAIQLYKQALAIKPGETYPQNRIKELDELIKNKEKIEKQYNDLIAKADNQFKAQDYENARANYEEASKLKPSEKYPQDRIAEIIEKSKTRVKLITEKINEKGERFETFSIINMFVGLILSIFVYLFIFLYGTQVMRGVLEEKTNRIVEIIISSVKPIELMMGKITGIALVALTQFVIWIITVLILYSAAMSLFLYKYDNALKTEQLQKEILIEKGPITGKNLQSLPKDVDKDFYYMYKSFKNIDFTAILFSFAFYFLFGYLMYAALYAAIGAAVDNDADSQQFLVPVSVPLILGYVISSSIFENPEGTVAFWFSIIPLTSPIVMMIRLPFGVPMWELLLSMVLVVVGFVFFTWLAAKIYRTGILLYGQKVTWKDLFLWIKAGK